ncbi:MAG: DJ-1/PfpI family protein [Bacilli bacterium]|nr:DJ-1/PfpI family protein [Bacilli bacterium]
MKGLLLLADGFEDTEALTTRDVLLRAGFEIITCSIKQERAVTSSFGVEVMADSSSQYTDPMEFDFLILPGGGTGVRNLAASHYTTMAINNFISHNRYVFAICAAPSLLGRLGHLKDKNFTCFPGFEVGFGGNYIDDQGVVVDGNIITARSMYYSIDFALEITRLLKNDNDETMNRVLDGIKGLKDK